MIQNETNHLTEEKINSLFETIHFTKVKNQKILSKWKKYSVKPIGSSLIYQLNDWLASVQQNTPSITTGPTYQEQTRRNQEYMLARQELLAQLEEIDKVLRNDGEEAAEKLLRQYAQTFPDFFKWIALIILIAVGAVFIRALILSA